MRKLLLAIACLGFVAVAVLPGSASADVNNFTITSFNADETISRNDPQGELHIVEDINVVFTDNNHGILRAIPDSYKHHSLQLKVNKISSASGAPTQYSTYGSNGNTVLKIGDPDQTVTGAQEYTIDYTLRNVISFYNDHDELYWDVNGDQWDQTFQSVSVQLHMPSGLIQNREPVCYAAGSVAYQSCAIVSQGNVLTATIKEPLPPRQTLTYVSSFDKGYFRPSTWKETVGEYSSQIIGFFAPLILLGGASLLIWLRFGRDPKGSGIIVPQYDAPDGLSPLEVGTIIDFKTDNRDITATIIGLAVKRYIKIIETKQKQRLMKDSLSYQLQLLNADYSQLNPDEASLMAALFGSRKVGEVVMLDDSKKKLYNTAQALRSGLKSRMITNGYFRRQLSAPSFSKNTIFTIVIALFFIPSSAYAAITTLGFGLISGLIIGAVIALICFSAMSARTAKGVVAKEHILGLKMYLETAEKTRLEKLQAPDAQYAPNASEPVKTVELFEKLLPYAIALKVESQWAKQFEGLYQTPPDWYSGNWSTFNAYYLASSLSNGVGEAVNSAFSAPSSSGGSGFGGGGFSGGGGGGGGGGGW